MTKEQLGVREFMTVFGQETPEKPTQLDEKTARLRASLILEEALETITKGLGLSLTISGNGPYGVWTNPIDEKSLNDTEGLSFNFFKKKEVDLVELADGLADLSYVASHGTSVAAGIDLEPIEAEVHASNMSKLWKKEELSKAPAGSTYTPVDNDLFIVKREDGKAIKSPSYRPANIKAIIDSQSA